MAMFAKPENALRRAEELINVGQKQDALQVLHGKNNVLYSNKGKQELCLGMLFFINYSTATRLWNSRGHSHSHAHTDSGSHSHSIEDLFVGLSILFGIVNNIW